MKVFYGKIFTSDFVQNHWPDFCHLVCQMKYHTKVAFFFVDFWHWLHIRGLVYRDICSTMPSHFECVRLPRFKVQFLCSYYCKTLETQMRSQFEFSLPFSQSCPLHYMILLIQLLDRFSCDWTFRISLMQHDWNAHKLTNTRERERERERETAAAAAHSFTRHWNHDGDFLGLAKRNKPSTSRPGTCPNGCICIQFQGESYCALKNVTWGFSHSWNSLAIVD